MSVHNKIGDSSRPDVAGYAAAFGIYHQRGWPVVPLPKALKKWPPKGFTGRDGAIPSYADMLAWADDKPDGNLAIRLLPIAIGIDVDNYDGKTGGATLAEGEKRWGKLPPSYRSSARSDDDISGIRPYRIPEGVELAESIKFPELGLGGIEICQFHHRYVIAWPSIHETLGTLYRWYDDIDGTVMEHPPALDDIPELPPEWVEALTEPQRNGAELPADGLYDVRAALTEGKQSPAVSRRLGVALGELFSDQCRHDAIRDGVLGLLRVGKHGEPGVKQALNALCEAFVNRVGKNRKGGRAEALAEFKSFVYGDKVPALLADPAYDHDDEPSAGETGNSESNDQQASEPVFARPKLWHATQLKPVTQPRWIAKRFVPRAAPTVLCGDEGIGKTLWDIRLVAAVSTGRPLPDINMPKRDPQPVLLAAITEEDWSTIVLPRLEVAGADLDMISVICTEQDGSGSPMFPRDFDIIREMQPKPFLIVVDSWLDTLSANLVVRDSQSAALALAPWTDLATKTDAGIILLTPTNRMATGDIREKYGVTQHLRKKARMTLFSLRDDDTDLLVLGPDKVNTTTSDLAAMYRIDAIPKWEPTDDDDGTVGRLEYVATSDRTIREWVTDHHEQAQNGADDTELSTAMKWLHDYLLPRLDAPRRLSDEVKAAAKKEKITAMTLRRARRRLRVVIEPVKGSVPFKTYWRLP